MAYGVVPAGQRLFKAAMSEEEATMDELSPLAGVRALLNCSH